MHVKDIEVKELNRAIGLAKALLYLPGADTSLTLEGKGKKLYIAAETAGIQIKATCKATVEKEGTVLVDMTHLSAPHLRAKTMSLKVSKEDITIRCGRSAYKLSAVEGECHSVKVPKPDSTALQMPISMLRTAINFIWFSHDDGGSGDLRLVLGKGKLLAETADEYKGCSWTHPMKVWKKTKKPRRIVLKKETADVISTSFDKDEIVYLDTTDTNIRLFTSDSLVSVPLVTATDLTDVSGMLKSRLSQLRMSCCFNIESDELTEIAYAAASVVEETAKLKSVHTYIVVDGAKNSMTIDAEGDIGSFSTKAKIEDYETLKKRDKPKKVCVLSKHLKDLVDLAGKTGKTLRIEIWGKEMVILRNIEGDYKAVYAFPQV